MKNVPDNTIKATDLRKKLDEVFDRVNAGQEIVVTHRFKQPLKLEPVVTPRKSEDLLAGLKVFDKARKRPSPYDSNAPLKELYSKSITHKYAA